MKIYWAWPDPLPPRATEITAIATITSPMTPMTIRLLVFFQQYFDLILVDCWANWDAPISNAFALSFSSESFWSRSRTFITLSRIIPATSSTWARVCSNCVVFGSLFMIPSTTGAPLCSNNLGDVADMFPGRKGILSECCIRILECYNERNGFKTKDARVKEAQRWRPSDLKQKEKTEPGFNKF